MSENTTHPRHWISFKLDPFEDLILNEFVRGSSLRSIRERLGKHKCYSQYFHYFRIHPIQAAMHAFARPMSNRRFSRRAPHKQADYIVRLGLALGKSRHDSRDDGRVHSLGTARSHQQALTLLCRWIQNNRLGDLRSASVA